MSYINNINKNGMDYDIYDKRISGVDGVVAQNSQNPVSGGAVYSALQNLSQQITALQEAVAELQEAVAVSKE